MGKTFYVSLIAVCVGLLLMLLSVIWPAVLPRSAVRSEEDAAARNAASLQWKSAKLSGSPDAEKMAQEFQAKDAELKSAKSLFTGPATFFKWSGIIITLLGVAGLWVWRATA